jgi:glycerophosphoryl diester phosphodiesterase
MKQFVPIFVLLLFLQLSLVHAQREVKLPSRGICAHRGANETHPENTLAAFREAVRLGAHMVEFDVQITKDKQLVIMHDKSVNRTTNGEGLVSDLTLSEIKKLDAGSWKSKIFIGEKVPTLKEALAVFPKNIWLNIHLKGNKELGRMTAKVIISEGRMHQGVIACGKEAASGVISVSQKILICNMERQSDRKEYVQNTIQGKYPFIQLLKKRNDKRLLDDIVTLHQNKVKINYYFGDTESEVKELFNIGVDFVLTNKLDQMLTIAEEMGIERLNQ